MILSFLIDNYAMFLIGWICGIQIQLRLISWVEELLISDLLSEL